MMYKIILILAIAHFSCKSKTGMQESQQVETTTVQDTSKYVVNKRGDQIPKIMKSDAEWKSSLSQMQYYVLREKGTERAFTSKLNDNKKDGLYVCSACNTTLFTSAAKFDSGTGWPSFYMPDDKNLIASNTDYDIGYARTEVMCGVCGGHLGHVFDDGPQPTGLRYCINGVSLDFIPALNSK